MRKLGKASLEKYRWDLVYLYASLLADDDPEVVALAPLVGLLLDDLRTERDLFERAEEAEIAASAVRVRRDTTLDRQVITFGGILRAISKEVYKRFFGRLSPSKITRAALAEEVPEVERLLGELAVLPPDDVMRTGHEAGLQAALEGLRIAMKAESDADVALSVARSRLEQFKLRADRERVVVNGKLTVIHGDAKVADSYFRPTSKRPGQVEAEDGGEADGGDEDGGEP